MAETENSNRVSDTGSPQAAFEQSLKQILSVPKDKIAEYERDHKPFRKAKTDAPK